MHTIEQPLKVIDKQVNFTGMKILMLFLFTLVCYALFDLAFINLFAKAFIQRQVGWLLAPRPDLAAAAIFYLIFVAGILYFCILPAASANRALLNGAFFGLVTYATYELVNKSLLDRWPWPLVLVDLAWGVFVGMTVSWLGWRFARWAGVSPL